ncbi:TetR/AcrR family transcriptional regulator [Streptomyces sp. NBC_00353]|uniref:TetR/AcrR family transcriptional regulator n=1 Tax=Streptomyces sp. NBC_00353 TaxID=2975722 RepID=UPI002E27049A
MVEVAIGPLVMPRHKVRRLPAIDGHRSEALDLAVEVFWRQGYEGTSITDLTTAMGMNKPSLYTVFGSKEKLFQRVVARYAERDMGYRTAALAEPTAAAVARTLLLENAKALTREDRPARCLSIQGGLSTSPDNASICTFLAASRLEGEQALADRFRTAVTDGDLPSDTNPARPRPLHHRLHRGPSRTRRSGRQPPATRRDRRNRPTGLPRRHRPDVRLTRPGRGRGLRGSTCAARITAS